MNKTIVISAMAAAALAGLTACSDTSKTAPATEKAPAKPGMAKGTIAEKPFGTVDGKEVKLYTLKNSKGVTMTVMNYGAIVQSLLVPDRDGKMADVVLGYNTVDEYVKETPYFGCIVGRYGNRIAKGQFKIGTNTYTLATNNDPGGIPCHLHGGKKGFDKVVWDAQPVQRPDAVGLKLNYLSKDGEEGYPGNLNLTVFYWLNEKNEWEVEYEATTDKPTPVNVTQHSYFNFAGEGSGDILGHRLMLKASKYTPVDKGLIPTGELAPVAGTPFDFTTPFAIGARVNDPHEQMQFGGGYDHNWVLDNQSGTLALAAVVEEPTTGRVMEIFTTEPGIQFYCGNFLDGKLVGKSGKPYNHRNGFCLETQHYPDSPNQPNFPSTILEPGQTYKTKTVFKFSTK